MMKVTANVTTGSHSLHEDIRIFLSWLLLPLLILSGCNGEWTETYESESNCSACYVVDDPLNGEGLVCTDDTNYTDCSGLLLE